MENSLKTEALEKIKSCNNLKELEEIRLHYLGKTGVIAGEMKKLGSLDQESRKSFGAVINEIKIAITDSLAAKKEELEKAFILEKIAKEKIDVTAPIRPEIKGTIHPISFVIDEIVEIFASMGFEVEFGPEVEDDFHNFTALNIPENHPARQMHDTFYMPNGMLLRTHTSSVEIRAMTNKKPPFRFIAPGRVYRCESDMTHSPMFHQLEGMLIDKDITMAHLKGCITEFLQRFFERDNIPVRFRPSFFPFTEPSAEVDIGCSRKNGELIIEENGNWMEVLGCGMTHPNVLRNVGIDPEEYQGFAFGMGIERLAMLKYGIGDVRSFFTSDVRWMKHYGF